MIKRIVLGIFAFLFLLSWAITGYVLYSKGINITHTYNQQQYQNQQQASIIMGMFAAKGSLTWKMYTKDDLMKMNFGEVPFKNRINLFLQTLPPEQSLFSKISSDDVVYVPVLKDK